MIRTPAERPDQATMLAQLLDTQLSVRSRLGYVALLLAALAMTTIVGALWATEDALPGRTQAAFALMTGIGLSWVTFSVWVLRHRRPLFANDRIVAGRMAVAFTLLFVVGALAVGFSAGGAAPFAAAGVGLAMFGAAIGLLIRARRAFARLTMRREALERGLRRDAQ